MSYVILEFISYCKEIKQTKNTLESGIANEERKTKKLQKL